MPEAVSDLSEHYTNPPKGKVEALLPRLNQSAHDPSSVRGGGSGKALSPGQIAAAFAYRPAMRVPEADRLLGKDDARRAIYDLTMYHHTMDPQCHKGIWSAVMLMIYTVGMEQRWSKVKVSRLRCLADTVIEDVCCPVKYRGLSQRQWSNMLGLCDHKSWQSTWRHRYDQIRQIVQALDDAGEEQIIRRI